MKLRVLLSLSVIVLIQLPSALGAAVASRPPNILFIMSDDHAAHAVSAYGSQINQTPNIDRIAASGTRFSNCFAVNSICTPSRAAILTGKYSHINGVTVFNRFDGSQPHVAKMLRQAGYQTAIIGKWHLFSDPTGFDYWNILPGQGRYQNPVMIEMGKTNVIKGYVTDVITDLSIQFLKNRDTTKPFLLLTHHKAPHREWTPDAKHAQMYDDADIPEPATFNDDYKGRSHAAAEATMQIGRDLKKSDVKADPPAGLSDEALKKWNYQRYIKDYLRCIASVDDNVGRLLDYLEQSGLSTNTIVIYTSDQGFFLGDHGWFDKRFMYEESLRMPFLASYPGVIKPGTVTDGMTLNVDFAPTFLELAGVKVPPEIQGRSIVPLLRGEHPNDWRTSMYYRYYLYPQDHRVQPHYGVRNGRYKLIYFNKLDEWELFDLQKDPRELKNVYADPAYSDTVKQMKIELAALKKEVKDEDQFADGPPPGRQRQPTAAAQRARLVLVAGGGTHEEGGVAAEVKFNAPFGVDFDSVGNMFTVELNGHKVRKMDRQGIVSTLAGTGVIGASGDGGPARQAQFNGIHNLAITRSGDILLADTWNSRVRKIDAKTGFVSTVAGTGQRGFSGDGGPAIEAQFGNIYCASLDPAGENLYLADLDNRRIRVVNLKTGIVKTVAGNGEKGVPVDGADAAKSPLVDPRAVAVDAQGTIYVLERSGNALRAVDGAGKIRTVVGTGQKGATGDGGLALQATLNGPKHLCVDLKGDVIIADAENHLVRKYLPKEGKLVRVAGTGQKGTDGLGGPPEMAQLNQPHGVYIHPSGTLYISDSSNNRVLKIER